jgi:hypothetical protein
MNELTPGANRLAGIDPERLLVVDVEEIAPLLDRQYAALASRGAALLATAEDWIERHATSTGRPKITDEQDFTDASDFFAQLRDHAGPNGEVDSTRKLVKAGPREAGLAIDAWFGNLRDRLADSIAAIDDAQGEYISGKLVQAQLDRERAATEARNEAIKLASEAWETGDEDVVNRAIAAEAKADEFEMAETNNPSHLTVRSRSVMGNSATGKVGIDWRLVSMMTLCRAVVDGDAPVDFVTTNDPVIRAAIKGKGGRRSVPGLDIFETTKIIRRGA